MSEDTINRSLNEKPEERLTLNEWLLRTKELGYFITQPEIRYEAKGWKSVAEFLGLMMCICLLFGCIMGGVAIGTKLAETKCETKP